MTRIRRINVSQVEGGDANNTDTEEIRPNGETAFYLDGSDGTDKLTLMMFNGTRTHRKSKVLAPGVLWGSNADSSDGNNYDTIKLIPDAQLKADGSDQYIVVDPTFPGHIHIRAGGTIDNSGADLYLGGENSYVKIPNGPNPDVIISANSSTWAFGSDGILALPSGAIIKDTATDSIAFGGGAGETSQGTGAVAIGEGAGYNTQGNQAVAIGRGAGNVTQGVGAVGVGFCAGATDQGDYAVAIGFKAARGNMDNDGTPNQPANSIMINASSTPLNGDQAGLYINPVREDTTNTGKVIYYNTTTKELTYADPTGGGGSGDSLVSDNTNITVTINNAVDPGNTLTWTFDTDGFVNLPNGGVVGDIFGEGMAGIQANPNDSNSYASLVSSDKQQAVDANNDEVRILTDDSAQGGSSTNEWRFNRSGQMIFPDATTQTTAFTGTTGFLDITNTNGLATTYYITFVENRTAGQEVRADVDLTYNTADNKLGVGAIGFSGGNFRVVNVSTASTGASGDKEGDIAFSSGYIYYCFADFGSFPTETFTVVNVGQNTNVIKVNMAANPNYTVPQAGWYVIIGGVTMTLSAFSAPNGSDFDFLFDNASGTGLPSTVTLTSNTSYTNIWKRLAWSGDTW